jgi:hypothetical protein
MTNRVALQVEELLKAVFSDRGCGQTEDLSARTGFEKSLEGRGRHVMAFVDNHEPISLE